MIGAGRADFSELPRSPDLIGTTAPLSELSSAGPIWTHPWLVHRIGCRRQALSPGGAVRV